MPKLISKLDTSKKPPEQQGHPEQEQGLIESPRYGFERRPIVKFPTYSAGNALVAARTAKREGFERGQLTVRPYHVIVGDFDRGEIAGM